MKEVAGRRERFEAFLKDKVEPLLIELEVAGENLQAAQTAGADAAFADSAGRITAAQALANLTAISNVRRDAAPPLGPDSGAPRLTIRRD